MEFIKLLFIQCFLDSFLYLLMTQQIPLNTFYLLIFSCYLDSLHRFGLFDNPQFLCHLIPKFRFIKEFSYNVIEQLFCPHLGDQGFEGMNDPKDLLRLMWIFFLPLSILPIILTVFAFFNKKRYRCLQMGFALQDDLILFIISPQQL